MNLVERAKNLILTPAAEWDKISAETHTVQDLYTGWIMILAAIPALATFVGFSLVGVGAFGLSYRVPVMSGIAHAIASYLLALGSVYVFALVIDALSPTFGGEKNFLQAFKVAAFAPVASWLAGVFHLLPALSILAILGLYSVYLLYVGLPRLMKTPAEKAMPYTAVVIVVGIVISILVGVVSALLLPGRVGAF
ncbi:MAG: YIP1 family protein [Betaproteobacteria bacterium]|nr:YIP1 family protein [Betaproteobacteria bacterium]